MNKHLQRALSIAYIAFLLYLLFELVRKLLGGSLAYEELMIALTIAHIGYSMKLGEKINRIDKKLSAHIGWHKGQKHDL